MAGTGPDLSTAMLILLQYGDSAYPAGGYAQSWGLETAVAEGEVTDAATLAEACRSLLIHQIATTDAVAAAAACRATHATALETLITVDRRLRAVRAAREARLASERMGRQLLNTAVAVEGATWLVALREAVQTGSTPGNHAIVVGAVLGDAGVDAPTTAGLVVWMSATGLLSAAQRLMRISHIDTQRILTGLRPLVAMLAAEAAAADPATLAGTAPAWELWSMQHEVAEVRLFAS